MKIEKLNYNLKTITKQRVQDQMGFGDNRQMQTQKQGYETSGSVGMTTDKTMSVPLRSMYLSGKVSKTSKAVPYAIISFGKKNKKQEVFVGAELPPYCKIGGVGTVANDYKSLLDGTDRAMFMPYYNGKKCYDDKGCPTKKYEVLKFPPGTIIDGNDVGGEPFYTAEDLTENKISDIINRKKYYRLEPVGNEENMGFGFDNDPIRLYKVKGTNHYMVFTQGTAALPKAYNPRATIGAGSKPASHYSSNASGLDHGWQGDPYAQFSKAFVQLLPQVKTVYNDKTKEDKEFNPGTIVCSDSQTALIPHFMATESQKSGSYYDDDIKPTYVAHNLGQGYVSTSSYKEMYINLGATFDQLQKVKNDPLYHEICATQNKKDEEGYFKNLIIGKDENLCIEDDLGEVSGVMLAIHYAKQGYIPKITTVSEDYAKDVAYNPAVSPGLQKHLKELYEKNTFLGILNALNDPNLTPNKRLCLPGYGYAIFEATNAQGETTQLTSKDLATKILSKNQRYKELSSSKNDNEKDEAAKMLDEKAKQIEDDASVDGTKYGFKTIKKTADAFTTYSNLQDLKELQKLKDLKELEDIPDDVWDNIQKAKANNKYNFIQRFKQDGCTDSLLLTGLTGRKVKQIGALDFDTITAGLDGSNIEKLQQCKLTVSWGRGDLQKGLDTTMRAWAKTARLDKNAFLILGGELPAEGEDVARVKRAIDDLSGEFKGRFVFMDGFAPGVALSAAADIASLPSRFAPCELTDLEAMHFGVIPVVTNCQGLKQKNFDPEVDYCEKDDQTSFKTRHQFFMTHEDLCKYDDAMEKAIGWLNKHYESSFKGFLEEKKFLVDCIGEDGNKKTETKYQYFYNTKGNPSAKTIDNWRKDILAVFDKNKPEYKDKDGKNDEKLTTVVRELLSASYEFKTSGFKEKFENCHNINMKKAKTEAENAGKEPAKTFIAGIEKNEKENKDYKDWMQTARDAIIENEMAMSIIRAKAALSEKQTHKKLFKNAISLDTTFRNNAKLHPKLNGEQLSTETLYQKYHIDGSSKKPTKVLNVIAPPDPIKPKEGGFMAKITTLWKGLSIGGKIGVICGTIAGVAAICLGAFAAGSLVNKKKFQAEAANKVAEAETIDNTVNDAAGYDDVDDIDDIEE